MIFVKRGKDVVVAYIYECYRRLYAAAMDENGNYGDFDILKKENIILRPNGEVAYDIPYEDYYLSHHAQKLIIDEVVKENFRYIGFSTNHKLKDYQKQSVSSSVCLGCSPFSSASAFIKKHPNAKNYISEEELAQESW